MNYPPSVSPEKHALPPHPPPQKKQTNKQTKQKEKNLGALTLWPILPFNTL